MPCQQVFSYLQIERLLYQILATLIFFPGKGSSRSKERKRAVVDLITQCRSFLSELTVLLQVSHNNHPLKSNHVSACTTPAIYARTLQRDLRKSITMVSNTLPNTPPNTPKIVDPRMRFRLLHLGYCAGVFLMISISCSWISWFLLSLYFGYRSQGFVPSQEEQGGISRFQEGRGGQAVVQKGDRRGRKGRELAVLRTTRTDVVLDKDCYWNMIPHFDCAFDLGCRSHQAPYAG
jgi:hypothetical protein